MTRPAPALNLYAADGSPIRIGQELGRGGEGVVYELENRPGEVAKIYLAPVDSQKADKLQVMVSQCTVELTKLAAWPSGLVLDQRRHVAGLIMKKITGFRPVHELYTPKSRLQDFPRATWAFLVHAATNVARAFAVVHSHGVVIGDVNHGNVVVNDAALCVLIDCDSFQVTNNGHRFLCEVGVSAYTPPELQGQDFATFVRTENHDNFGLALLIFHLLMMGRHPFAGRFLGRGDMSVERAIAEYRFAFSANSKSLQMEPPPNSLGLSDLPPSISAMFEQAFSAASAGNSGRPKALEWITSLEALSRDLIKCPRNACHVYYKQVIKCPWCRLEDRSALVFFLQLDVAVGLADYKIDAIWARIMSVPGPGHVPPLEVRKLVTQTFAASTEAKAAGRRRKRRIGAAFGLVAVVIVTALLGGSNLDVLSGSSAFSIVTISIYILAYLWKNSGKPLKFLVARESAAARYEALEDRWEKEASEAQFVAKRVELKAIKKEFESLPAVRHERMHVLEKSREKIQLHKSLDQHYIRDAHLPGIGHGRVALLSSYGIDTAADLNWKALQAVDGIGPRNSSRLMQWRDSVAGGFIFNPRLGIDAQEVAKLDREIGQRRHYLQQRLSAGIPELEIIRQRTISARTSLQRQTLEAFEALMQAEADVTAS